MNCSELRDTYGRDGGLVDPDYYDLFEKFPNGSVLWRALVPGLDNALARLKELAKLSPNEHFAIHTPSNSIVARVNAPKPDVPQT
jgi:hypothetical protein